MRLPPLLGNPGCHLLRRGVPPCILLSQPFEGENVGWHWVVRYLIDFEFHNVNVCYAVDILISFVSHWCRRAGRRGLGTLHRVQSVDGSRAGGVLQQGWP